MIERIYVRGRPEAMRFESEHPLLIISVSDPASDLPQFASIECDILSLRFHDVCLIQWDAAELRERWPDCKPMLPYNAKQIGPFLSKKRHDPTPDLLVHCEAGLSRSPSIAMAICDSLNLNRSIIDWGGRDVNQDAPNQHVYNLCVEALVLG